jgi:hypothetical protein
MALMAKLNLANGNILSLPYSSSATSTNMVDFSAIDEGQAMSFIGSYHGVSGTFTTTYTLPNGAYFTCKTIWNSSPTIKITFTNAAGTTYTLYSGSGGITRQYRAWFLCVTPFTYNSVLTPRAFTIMRLDATEVDTPSVLTNYITIPETAISETSTQVLTENSWPSISSSIDVTGIGQAADIWAELEPYVTISETFPGENSGEGGGTGTFDISNQAVDFPSLPTLSAVDAGFITIYAPTISQLNDLASFMWSESFDITTFKKLFANPMDAILGLSIVPVSISTSGLREVKIGLVSTGVSMNIALSQYISVDCGYLDTSEYWGSALDYSPYTKFSIYLPYIGTRTISTDEVMGKRISVRYNIDILSGSLTAMIRCGESVLYQFSGACACSVPVASQDFVRALTSAIQLAGQGVATAVSGGSPAGLLSSTANAVSSMKPNIQHTGSVSGAAGMLGIQNPYLIWELPKQSLAQKYNTFVGYPCNITSALSDLTGFTQIEKIHLESISATSNELQEIENLLMQGVIL